IGLRQDQRQRMQEIRKSHDDEVISAGRRLRQARAALDREIMSETYSEAAVHRATEELAQAQADKIRLDARIRSEVRGVLTPEQVGRFHVVEREIRQQMKQEQQQQEKQPDQQQRQQQQQGAMRFDSGTEMGFEDALELDAFAQEPLFDDEIDLVELLL